MTPFKQQELKYLRDFSSRKVPKPKTLNPETRKVPKPSKILSLRRYKPETLKIAKCENPKWDSTKKDTTIPRP